MKKVLKSKIFIVIITAILFIGIGIYASNTYKAETISYTPSDGSGSIDVSKALNELYDSIKQCSTNEFCSNVKLGDYVRMNPTETTFTILKITTGYSDDQIINPSELNLWRVIKKNDDGTVEMVSENVSSKGVYFQGKTGYLNFVGTLNTIASQYGNSKYTKNARMMGYNGQTATITDTSKFTTIAPWTNSTRDNNNESVGGGDIMYKVDTDLVNETLGTLKANDPLGTSTSYWLASRIYDYNNSSYYSWSGRYINTEGNFNSGYLYYYYNGWNSIPLSYAIRPIVTIKLGITTTGSGTKVDPWVLE